MEMRSIAQNLRNTQAQSMRGGAENQDSELCHSWVRFASGTITEDIYPHINRHRDELPQQSSSHKLRKLGNSVKIESPVSNTGNVKTE
jgi:hypothetical protein